MSKTFREVIRNIKPNETYKCDAEDIGLISISCDEDSSIIISTPYRPTKIKLSYKFEKVRDKFSFDVAFKEYLNGKEIESCYSGYKFKIINGIHSVKIYSDSAWEGNKEMLISEIEKDWYIND